MARASRTDWLPFNELLQALAIRQTLRALSTVLLIALLALTVVWSLRDNTAHQQSVTLAGEHLTHVELQSFASLDRRPIEYQFFGIVRARRSVNLSSKLSERVSAWLVAIGDSVAAGQPLIELEKEEHQAALAIAQAELAGAQAKLQELKSGPRDEEIAAAVAVVEERRAVAFMHQQTFQRMTSAAQSGVIALGELQDANYGQQASQAQFRQAQERLAELRAGARREQLAGQQALVDAQQARVTQLETRLAECTLCAPFSGRVQKRWVDEGELVAPMQPILTLVESEAMEVHVGLPPAIATALSRSDGQQPTIDVRIHDASVAVKLSSLAPALDPQTGTRQAIFAVKSSEPMLFASGESATLVLQLQSSVGYWVPRSALTSLSHGMWGLWIAHPTTMRDVYKLERRPVEIAAQQGEWLQIDGGLSAQELFVLSGVSRLSPEQFVRYLSKKRR